MVEQNKLWKEIKWKTLCYTMLMIKCYIAAMLFYIYGDNKIKSIFLHSVSFIIFFLWKSIWHVLWTVLFLKNICVKKKSTITTLTTTTKNNIVAIHERDGACYILFFFYFYDDCKESYIWFNAVFLVRSFLFDSCYWGV